MLYFMGVLVLRDFHALVALMQLRKIKDVTSVGSSGGDASNSTHSSFDSNSDGSQILARTQNLALVVTKKLSPMAYTATLWWTLGAAHSL